MGTDLYLDFDFRSASLSVTQPERADGDQPMSNRPFRLDRLLIYPALIFWAIISIFPLLWMVSVSFKPAAESLGGITSMIPREPTLWNYERVAMLIPLGR